MSEKINNGVIRYGINGNVKLPYVFQPGEKVTVNFHSPFIPPFKAIVAAVKYNAVRPRYDLDVILHGEGEDIQATRIHSVDSFYVGE